MCQGQNLRRAHSAQWHKGLWGFHRERQFSGENPPVPLYCSAKWWCYYRKRKKATSSCHLGGIQSTFVFFLKARRTGTRCWHCVLLTESKRARDTSESPFVEILLYGVQFWNQIQPGSTSCLTAGPPRWGCIHTAKILHLLIITGTNPESFAVATLCGINTDV